MRAGAAAHPLWRVALSSGCGAAILAIACRGHAPADRLGAEPHADAGPVETRGSSDTTPPVRAPGRGAESTGWAVIDGEAHRRRVTRLDAEAWLRPARSALVEAFGPALRGPFDVERADLVGGGSAGLVTPSAGGAPLALVVDGERLVWSKPRPTGGMVGPIEHLAIAPRPDGGVALFAWVASLHTVAARMWADDGNAFGDFEVFGPKQCDALSVAYALGRGWWVVCSSDDGTRGQRLRDDGTVAWDPAGVALGASSPAGPATVVIDAPSTAMLFQRVIAIGGDRLMVFRYDTGGRSLWVRPLDLGVIRDSSRRGDRLEAVRLGGPGASPERVRLTLPVSLEGRSARALDIGPDGDVFPVR